MRLPRFLSATAPAVLLALSLAVPAAAQGVQVFGGPSMRASSSLILFGDDMMAGLTVTHGQPEWRDEYTAMLDKLKGKINRLGKDMWTTLATSVPIEIGGAKIAPGLHCDQDGVFSLALIDSTKAMKGGLMPFGPQNWKPEVTAPLKLDKDVVDEAVGKMTISLTSSDDDPMQGTFTIAWGPHTLTAPLKIHQGK